MLEIKILAFGNLAFRLLFNCYAAIIMSCHRSVLSDEVENLVLFCGGVDDEMAVLILSLDPLVFMRAFPLPLRGAGCSCSGELGSDDGAYNQSATILNAVFRGVLCTLSAWIIGFSVLYGSG